MSPTRAETNYCGGVEAHRLKKNVTRLREVRRRFVLDAGDGEQYVLIEDRLDSIVLDLDGWLKPGGRPIDMGGLDFRLAAVEEMIEAVGFPGYARVIAGVREALAGPVGESNAEGEPPPPRRFVPPSGSTRARPQRSGGVDEWDLRAAAEDRQRGSGWLMKAVLIAGCVATAWLFFFRQTDVGPNLGTGSAAVVAVEESVVRDAGAAPTLSPVSNPEVADVVGEYQEEVSARFSSEITLAEDAVDDGDLDVALTHFAEAAALDRHHRRLTEVAESLIERLLREADEAFDRTQWEVAAVRIEDAGRIARGLYLDTSAIDFAARRHELMTRFEDVTPDDTGTISRAVGQTVRVTSIYDDVLFGRLESFEDDGLSIEIYAGFEGGGAEYSTTIPLAMIRELRIFEARSVSETVLEP